MALQIEGAHLLQHHRRSLDIAAGMDVGDAKLDFAGFDHGDDLVAQGVADQKLHARMLLAEFGDARRQEARRNRGQGADPHHAGALVAQVLGGGDDIVQLLQHLRQHWHQLQSHRGQAQLAGGAIEQRQAQRLFQLLDLNRDGRLGAVQGLRRQGEAAIARHGHEGAQLQHGDLHPGAQGKRVRQRVPT